MGANTANFVVRSYGGSTWAATTTGTRAAASTAASGVTSFGDFAVGSSCLTITP